MIKRKSTIFYNVLVLLLVWGISSASAQGNSGFRALSGSKASQFDLPSDVELVKSMHLEAYGLTYERYQQFYGDAKVLGGQLTLYWNDSGELQTVIGAHYPNIVPNNSISLGKADARGIADRDIGSGGKRTADLMIDPKSGKYFYRVETRRLTSRWIHWVGAQSGNVINKFDSLMNCGSGGSVMNAPCGNGAHYDGNTPDTTDVKDLTGLTTNNGSYRLTSPNITSMETHDQGSTNKPFTGPIASDSNDEWVLSGRTSPGQGALVDAHYYAALTEEYYWTTHNFNFPAPMNIQAHFFKDYVNAFWNGDLLAFGDGDGISFNELTSLDVVGHELTHAVTEFTSNLVYQNESGALNESFSDMMGNTLEFYAAANGAMFPDPAASLTPDWLVGEDFDIRPGQNGFRNMGDPEEDGDPDHYSERYTGTSDNGGVHTNSGIPNHAYYLAVNGGQNASCANQANRNSAHCSNGGDLSVTALGLSNAEKIFYSAFIGLNSTATMCDAREATEAQAKMLFGDGSTQHTSTLQAWDAVGVTCGGGGTGNNPPDVSINNPSNGDIVAGASVLITAIAADTDGTVDHVEFFVDGTSLGTDADDTDGWSVFWDTNSVEDGNHGLTATATDNDGDSTTSTSITVTVDNVPDPICNLALLGEACTFDGDCCSNKCKGKRDAKTCK